MFVPGNSLHELGTRSPDCGTLRGFEMSTADAMLSGAGNPGGLSSVVVRTNNVRP
jgi:hypothetical protein